MSIQQQSTADTAARQEELENRHDIVDRLYAASDLLHLVDDATASETNARLVWWQAQHRHCVAAEAARMPGQHSVRQASAAAVGSSGPMIVQTEGTQWILDVLADLMSFADSRALRKTNRCLSDAFTQISQTLPN